MPKWKNVNVLHDQIEDIEKIIKNPFINEKYRILNVPEFIEIGHCCLKLFYTLNYGYQFIWKVVICGNPQLIL